MREVKVPIYFSISAVLLWFIPKRLTKQRSFIAIIPWHIEATVPFRSSKRLGRIDRGQAANIPTKTPTQTWWNTKAWQELSPPGLPQLSVELGANSGKHKPRHHVYANDYYSNLVPRLQHSVERNSRKRNKARTEFRQIISSKISKDNLEATRVEADPQRYKS